jgi:DWNN domain
VQGANIQHDTRESIFQRQLCTANLFSRTFGVSAKLADQTSSFSSNSRFSRDLARVPAAHVKALSPTMSVQFKFKSARDYDAIPFDGMSIRLLDLKRAIAEKRGLQKGLDFDLVITNAQTSEGGARARAAGPLCCHPVRVLWWYEFVREHVLCVCAGAGGRARVVLSTNVRTCAHVRARRAQSTRTTTQWLRVMRAWRCGGCR